jgi:RNA polymerase sigma factor (sigma-70 family)
MGANEMAHGKGPVERRSPMAPADTDFWCQVLGVGWERRGTFVAMAMAYRLGVFLTEEDARDVFAEALLRCLSRFRESPGNSSMQDGPSNQGLDLPLTRGWLRGFVYNVIRERKRKAARRPGDFGQGAEDRDVPGVQAIDELAVRRLVDRACKMLTPRQRQIFERFYLGNSTQSSIAEELGTSTATVNREVEKIRAVFYEFCKLPLPDKGVV